MPRKQDSSAERRKAKQRQQAKRRRQERQGRQELGAADAQVPPPPPSPPPAELSPASVLVVDANNVRGADGFTLSTARFVHLLCLWTEAVGLQGRVVCSVDHGCRPTAVPYRGGVVMAWSGSHCTADDCIAEDAHWFRRAVVVTHDHHLRKRCLRPSPVATALAKAVVLPSLDLLEVLLRVPAELTGTTAAAAAVLPTELVGLQQCEEQMRGASAEAATSAGSSGEFGEVTWQRVLTAEVLRRSVQTWTQEHDPAAAASPQHSDLDWEARRRLMTATMSKLLPPTTDERQPATVAAFVRRRTSRKLVVECPTNDHRIRNDGAQRQLLQAHVRDEPEDREVAAGEHCGRGSRQQGPAGERWFARWSWGGGGRP